MPCGPSMDITDRQRQQMYEGMLVRTICTREGSGTTQKNFYLTVTLRS